jgi:hypothetical protein
MVLTTPGSIGLFIVLQEVLKQLCDNVTQVRLIHAVLKYFFWLATYMTRRPTWISKLIPANLPATLGVQDASGHGMGGVHVVTLPKR